MQSITILEFPNERWLKIAQDLQPRTVYMLGLTSKRYFSLIECLPPTIAPKARLEKNRAYNIYAGSSTDQDSFYYSSDEEPASINDLVPDLSVTYMQSGSKVLKESLPPSFPLSPLLHWYPTSSLMLV